MKRYVCMVLGIVVVGLARALRVSPRTVRGCLQELEAGGLIVFRSERRGRGARALIRVRAKSEHKGEQTCTFGGEG